MARRASGNWLRFDPGETLRNILLSTLREAFVSLQVLLGSDTAMWEWGNLHHALLAHPLSPLVDAERRGRWNLGPVPREGSGDTVGNTAYRGEDFGQTGGSSFRLVVDVGAWDGSLAMNSPGQSGNPRSGHYADLFAPWAADGAFPLLYDRDRVLAATVERIVLRPEAAG